MLLKYQTCIYSLRLGVSNGRVEELLLGLDEQGISHTYKVGVMYCRAGQYTEEHMYNNEEAGLAFYQFMDSIAQRVRLKSFNKYRAGLDNKSKLTTFYNLNHIEFIIDVKYLWNMLQ